MNCQNCSDALEIYSLEYKWNGTIMEPRTWYYCDDCHQIWTVNDNGIAQSLVLAQLAITETSAQGPYPMDCDYCHNCGGEWVEATILRKHKTIFKQFEPLRNMRDVANDKNYGPG